MQCVETLRHNTEELAVRTHPANVSRRRGGFRARAALGAAVAAVVAPGAFYGAAGAATPTGTAAASATSWFTYQRPAHYSAVYSFVQIPMRDGQKLACDLQQPGTGTPGQLDAPGSAPAPGRFPGIINNYTPYAAANGASALSANGFATVGYDVLNCDMRGLARSQATAPGQTWSQPYAAISAQDNYDMIEWLAAQPFSNGRIGQTGGSAGAQTSTLVAELRPPHLRAIVSMTAASDMYSDSRYKGGVLVAWGPVWAGLAGALSGGGANPALITAQYKEHPLDDAYWSSQSPDRNFSALTIPDLQLEGWQDTDFPGGALRIFQGTVDNIDPRDPSHTGPWAVQGPWGHAGSPTCTPSPACGVTLQFFDHFLRHDAKAAAPPARVQLFQEPEQGGKGWQTFASWPPAGTKPLVLHLNGTKLSETSARASSLNYRVSSTDAVTAGTPLEQPGQALTFTSDRLKTGVAVVGNPVLKLVASLTADDGIFVVQLEDVAPDGSVSYASAVPWYLKASHRLSHSYLTPVQPGKMTPYTISGWPLDYLFQKGHSIRIKVASAVDVTPVASSPSPNTMAEQAPPGDVNIATGHNGSYLTLPTLRQR